MGVFSNSRVWVAVWGGLISLAWLIPNHFPPWAGFHADAWMACVTLLGGVCIWGKNKGNVEWHGISMLTLILIFVPWIQYSFGILPFASQAWLSSGYLLCFLLALLIGAQWERAFSAQLADALFGAITLAAVASVGLALGSWMGVINTDIDSFLSMGYYGGRHYANLGQPNLLATLILWGVIGCLWAYIQGSVRPVVALFACIYLVLGLTLTRSRMAYVASFLLLATVWGGWRHWKTIWLPWCALGIFVFYLLSPSVLYLLDANILFDDQNVQYMRSVGGGELRLSAWKLFLNALLYKPWFGYGWTEVAGAQIEVAQNYPGLGGVFGHAHNIALDLIIWVGIPMGGAIFLYLIYWALRGLLSIKDEKSLVLFMVLIVIGVHSMFEYPLQYAYFLIPTGLVVGILNVRLEVVAVFRGPRWLLALLLTCAALLLSQIIHDYLNIQNSYNAWRFERAGIVYPEKNVTRIPDVRVLTQFKYWFEMIYTQPFKGMSASDLMLREEVTRAYPSSGAILELAVAYGKNGEVEKAKLWLSRVCKLSSVQECMVIRNAWVQLQKNDSDLAVITWLKTETE